MRHYVYSPALSLIITVLILFSALPALGKVIHVPADQPTIQAGIDSAANGDTVLVSPGTYKENISFNGKSITVASQSGPAVTIIDGQQLNTVVTFTGGETRKAVLRGFTIQNGGSGYPGGGVTINNASPIIEGNIVTMTNSGCGRAVSSNDGGALIQYNLINGNTPPCIGVALELDNDSSDDIIGNIISNTGSTGIDIGFPTGEVNVTGNSITDNAGTGVIYNGVYGNAANIVGNLVTGNQGGGIYSELFSPVTVINNTVFANSGGGCCSNPSEVYFYTADQQVTFDNNLIVGVNSTPALVCSSYDPGAIFQNNDIFSTEGPRYGGSCPDLTGSSGNISQDPLFTAPLSGDLHIQSKSPVINAGTNSAPNLPKKDLDGDPRILGKIVDIGVDEYSPKTTLTLSSLNLQYPQTEVGQTSSPQTVTLTNHGTTAIKVNLIATGSDFTQNNNCGGTLAANSDCQINVSFAPIDGGARSNVLGIFTGATANPQTVSLHGAGLAPQVRLDSTYIYFNNQVIGTTGQQLDNLTNTGQAPLSINSFQMTGAADFSQSNDCPTAPATLAPGAYCTITVSYTPTVAGYENATLNIDDNALPSPQQVNINGNSVSAGVPTLNPGNLTFPDTWIGYTSDPQYVTLTNTGTGPLGNINIQSPSDFPTSNDCPASLAVGAFCTITVSFSPIYLGQSNEIIWVNNDSAYTGQISVSGNGLAPVPTISSLSPPNLAAGSPDTQITINGTGFVYGAQVSWNGVLLGTYVPYSTQLYVTVPAAYLQNAGTAQVTVVNPQPGGGTSNPATFTVYNATSYSYKSIPFRYEKITGTNLNLSSFETASVESPFPIQFGGGSFNDLVIDAGGNLSFVNTGGEFNQPLPVYSLYTIIAPLWSDLYPWGTGTDNNVFWAVTGTAPNRHLVLEWRNVSYSCCDQSGLYTVRFEVVFAENNPEVLFNYADTVFGGPYSYADNGARATVGIQVTPSLSTQYTYDSPSISSHTSLLWYPSSPNVNLSTSTLDFGYHLIGTRSNIQKVTLTNGGLAPLQIYDISIDNADFAQSNDCHKIVQPGHDCTIDVAFTPSQPQLESGTLTIIDNGLGGVQTVSLSGIGATTPVVIFPVYLNFGNVPVGTNKTLPVTLANANNQPLTIQQILAEPDVYTQNNNCGSSLDPGANCTINVTFTPTKKGSVNGDLKLGINNKPAKVSVRFTGTGS